MRRKNKFEKECSQCKIIKPLSEYKMRSPWKDNESTPQSYCKSCGKILGYKNYIKNREKKLKYAKERYKNPIVKKRMIETTKKMHILYPEKRKARYTLKNAVSRGKIKQLYCLVCDDSKSEAHHYLGYNGEHWKDVIWLCKKHHMELHRKYVYENEDIIMKDYLKSKC
jgi:hypothetical protein